MEDLHNFYLVVQRKYKGVVNHLETDTSTEFFLAVLIIFDIVRNGSCHVCSN